MLTNTQKQMVTNLRLQGLTYAEIAAATELSPNTVKSFCRRRHIKIDEAEPSERNICKNCGRPLTQHPVPHRMVEQKPPQASLPFDLLLLRERVYQFWE